MLSILLVLSILLNFNLAEAQCNCGEAPSLAERYAYLDTANVENRLPHDENSLACLTVPFMATIRAVGTNKTLCSGVIVAPKMVLFTSNCLYEKTKDIPYSQLEVQVGSHSKSGGSFYRLMGVKVSEQVTAYPNYYLLFTLNDPIEFDCVNTLPICVNAAPAKASEFIVMGHSLKDAATRDYKDSGLYTVGTMTSFSCPSDHQKDSLCLYSDKIGLTDADEGGPALILQNGVFYLVGMAAGGHIMEYEDQFGRKGVISYAHYEILDYAEMKRFIPKPRIL